MSSFFFDFRYLITMDWGYRSYEFHSMDRRNLVCMSKRRLEKKENIFPSKMLTKIARTCWTCGCASTTIETGLRSTRID